MNDTRDEGMMITVRDGSPGGKRIITLEVFHESFSQGLAPAAIIYIWAPQGEAPAHIDTTVQGVGQLTPSELSILTFRVLTLVTNAVLALQEAITTHGFDDTIDTMLGLFKSESFRPVLLIDIHLLLNVLKNV